MHVKTVVVFEDREELAPLALLARWYPTLVARPYDGSAALHPGAAIIFAIDNRPNYLEVTWLDMAHLMGYITQAIRYYQDGLANDWGTPAIVKVTWRDDAIPEFAAALHHLEECVRRVDLGHTEANVTAMRSSLYPDLF